MKPSPPAPLPAHPPAPPGEGRSANRTLFPHYEIEALEAPEIRPFLLSRLLEDGDGDDLRQLFTQVQEPAAAAWLTDRGGRQLSVRSRAFWELVLGTASPASPDISAFWPL